MISFVSRAQTAPSAILVFLTGEQRVSKNRRWRHYISISTINISLNDVQIFVFEMQVSVYDLEIQISSFQMQTHNSIRDICVLNADIKISAKLEICNTDE